MKILAIDPGTQKIGIAYFNDDGLISSTNILVDDNTDINERYRSVAEKIKDVIVASKFKPDIIAIETPFCAFNVRVAITLGTVRGVIIGALYQIFKRKKFKVLDIMPIETRRWLGLDKKSKKQDCHKVILTKYSSICTTSEDELDAIAIGLAAFLKKTNAGKIHSKKVKVRKSRNKK